MKCPECGTITYNLTKEGDDALREIGYPVDTKVTGIPNHCGNCGYKFKLGSSPSNENENKN